MIEIPAKPNAVSGGVERHVLPLNEPMRSAYLTLNTESDSEAERIFGTFRRRPSAHADAGETFFASRFGQVRDRFGINWMIVHERPISAS
jgi:PhnB protein